MWGRLFLLGVALLLPAQQALAGAELPLDAGEAAKDGERYAWKLFAALNRPASARQAGEDGPRIWETWMNGNQVFLEDGRDPGPWSEAVVDAGPADAERFEAGSLKDLPNPRHIVDGRMVPMEEGLDGAHRLTESRINPEGYGYLRALSLYCIEGQLAAAGQVDFPRQTVEIKAQWRPIRAQERASYHAIEVRTGSGRVQLYGLSALHLASKVLPHWFWATFEHAEVAAPLPAGSGPVGTAWEHYRLRGVMSDYLDAAGQPARLANAELERGFEASSSCITCHARSSIGQSAGEVLRLPVFRSVEVRPTGIERLGYVGLPDARWFYGAQEPGGSWMRPLDFVWSLSLAKHRKPS